MSSNQTYTPLSNDHHRHLPGHDSLTHSIDSFWGPVQLAPLFSGGGLSHDLTRDLVPVPHVTSQVVHSDQPDQAPSKIELNI